MPTLNGITASIHTHDGKLDEFNVDEFPGGISCYIIAHSGQQFWLDYTIDHPIRASAVSVEFHVDGNRIDTQFPLASEGTSPPTVNPVHSNISSQYGKDEKGNVFRRDVFFALAAEKQKTRRHRNILLPSDDEEKAGMIECKVARAEKTGEWNGAISFEEMVTPEPCFGSKAAKSISHKARLGAGMPAAETVRYTFKNLDPDDAPFAHFRFYYRSKQFIQNSRFGAGFESSPVSRSSSPVQIISRPLSRAIGRTSSLYLSLTQGKDSGSKKPTPPSTLKEKSPELPEDFKMPRVRSKRMNRSTSKILATVESVRAASEPPPERPMSPKKPIFSKETAIANLQATITKLEGEISTAKNAVEHSELIQSCHDKLNKLRKSSELLRKSPKPKEKDVTSEDNVTVGMTHPRIEDVSEKDSSRPVDVHADHRKKSDKSHDNKDSEKDDAITEIA